jgi:flagellar biosynthesis protein FlhB
MADTDDKDQKTEEASPRRQEESREKGQVAMSNEFMAAIGLCVGMAMLAFGGRGLMNNVGQGIVNTIGVLPSVGTAELSLPDFAELLKGGISSIAGPLLMLTMPAIILTALAGYGQIGFRVTPKAMEVDLSKVSIIKGFGRLFSMRSVVRTLMAAAKVGMISGVVVAIAWHNLPGIVSIGDNELRPLLVAVGQIVLRCVFGALIVIVFLALIDFFYQRHQYSKDLRMSKQELKEEHRLTDGDPHVRARVRQLQREMSTRRMMDDVPESTVVVTNPTHFAVALKYDREAGGSRAMGAPVVTAKGVDHLAQRIKALAADSGVVLYEDVPLARALYAQCEVGAEIPEDLYAAVATVLGYVYRLDRMAAHA